jgi:predicted nucleic acid-binding protein
VTTYFVDTSALAKRYLIETGTNWIRGLLAPSSGHIIVDCDFTPIEFFSLLSRRLREQKLTPVDAAHLRQAFLAHHQIDYLSVPIEQPILVQARNLVTKYPLRPPDAIQLACALEATNSLGVPITFLCADNDLLSAAVAEGFAADNPNLHP